MRHVTTILLVLCFTGTIFAGDDPPRPSPPDGPGEVPQEERIPRNKLQHPILIVPNEEEEKGPPAIPDGDPELPRTYEAPKIEEAPADGVPKTFEEETTPLIDLKDVFPVFRDDEKSVYVVPTKVKLNKAMEQKLGMSVCGFDVMSRGFLNDYVQGKLDQSFFTIYVEPASFITVVVQYKKVEPIFPPAPPPPAEDNEKQKKAPKIDTKGPVA